jgi:hypothetical protein
MEDEIRSLWEQFQKSRRIEERNRLFEHYRRLVWATRNIVIPYTNEARHPLRLPYGPSGVRRTSVSFPPSI